MEAWRRPRPSEIKAGQVGPVGPNGTFRFTQFACPANGGYHFDSSNQFGLRQPPAPGLLALERDVRLRRRQQHGHDPEEQPVRAAGVGLPPVSASQPVWLSLTNNPVLESLQPYDGPTGRCLYAFNNAFDNCTNVSCSLTNGYNAYINCSGRLTPTNAYDVVLSSFTYTNGPLGGFYQFSTDLVDKGCTTADLVGLSHYTTQANQVQESNSIVDIGLHHLAVGANGVPVDPYVDLLAERIMRELEIRWVLVHGYLLHQSDDTSRLAFFLQWRYGAGLSALRILL